MIKTNLKVGDKVRVRSRDWYEMARETYGDVRIGCVFVDKMTEYCGQIVTIAYVGDISIGILEDHNEWNWSPEFFEEKGVRDDKV